MSRVNEVESAMAAALVDGLMQDTYLLVVELRHGKSAQNGMQLHERCAGQVEAVRQALEKAGMSPRSVDPISHAQCALLDETILHHAREGVHAKWTAEPLQAKFFNRHQAGEFLYEDMREILREPSPDPHVLVAFHRVLMLGFQGRYRDLEDPERQRLLLALEAQVAPLALGQGLLTRAGVLTRVNLPDGLQSPVVHVLAAGLLLLALWWGLDRWLAGVVAALLPVQG